MSYLKNKVFLSLIGGQLFYFASHSFAWAILPIYLISAGFQSIDLVWFYLITFLVGVLVMLSLRPQETRWVLVKGLLFRVAIILLMLKLVWEWQLWLMAGIYGLFWVLFWTTYNIRYFELSKTGTTAFASAISSSVGPFVAVFVPIITGFLAGTLGYYSSLIVSLIFLFASYASFKRIPKKTVQFDIIKAIQSTKSLKRLFFIDGVWQVSYYILIPIVTIQYLTSPVSYAAFISYVGISGVLASFILSKLSDKFNNRSIFIYPTSIAMAIFTCAAAFTSSLLSWFIVVGIFSFFRAMSAPLMLAISLDAKGDLTDAMVGREFMTSVGRLVGTIIVLTVYYFFSNYNIALLILGLIALFYPLVLYQSGVYAKVDKRMRFAARDRFDTMVKLWIFSPLLFAPKLIRKRWDSLKKFATHLQVNKILKRPQLKH